MYSVEFSEDAELDADEIGEYLDNQSSNLGYRFIEDVHAGALAISKNPTAFHLYKNYETIRRFNLTKFSYAIYFSIADNRVLILAIIHTRRSVSFVKRRLK